MTMLPVPEIGPRGRPSTGSIKLTLRLSDGVRPREYRGQLAKDDALTEQSRIVFDPGDFGLESSQRRFLRSVFRVIK